MTPQEVKEHAKDVILAECKKQDVTSPAQIAYILATVEWETNHTWNTVREAYWVSEAWRKRHLRYYPYYGRGFCQITWRDNYEKFGKLLGVDLVGHPDLALYPEYAAFILVYGMKHGTFTGVKLDDFITPSKTDYLHARKIINGMDKAHTVASMAQEMNLA